MAASAKSILKRAGEFFQNLEKKKLIMLIALAAVIIIAGIVGAILLNRVDYTVLFSGLDAEEAGTIKTVLDEKGILSKVQGTSTILVPEEQADELRIELASEGYPSTGLNYEIFSGSGALGSTDLERRTYLQYQLQENIRKALRTMEKVQDSIVMVNLASDSSFVVSDNQSEASAAVTLSLKNGEALTISEAKTIGQFVMKCVPQLKPENISIVDSMMTYYDISADNADSSEYSASQQQLTEELKNTLSEQVLSVLDPAFGKGNVAVSVNLNLNFDKETIDKVEFLPPVEGESEGLVRSFEEIYNAVGQAEAANGSVGTDPNGNGTPAYVAGDIPEGADISSTRTYNYELNEIQTRIEKAQGAMQDLSVAVLVNSNIEGVTESVDKVKNLVAKSIGVSPDYISIETMPFADNTSIGDAFSLSQEAADKVSRRNMIVTIIEVVVIAAAVVFIVRLFLTKSGRRTAQPLAAAGIDGGIVGMTIGDVAESPQAVTYDLSELVLKKSSEAEKIEELLDRYPETVAQILRTWIAEDN
jgi:flagellar M-ring protein FliF